jgi:hypothetical protein
VPRRRGQDPLPSPAAIDEAGPRPPEHPQACCSQQAITVPPDVLAKTSQKHDYPSAAWRRSYARRTGAERCFATAKDPAGNDIARGWCRLTGLAPLMLFTTVLPAVRNHRILAAWNARQDENARRAAKGLPPKTRRRRRKAPPRPPPRCPDPGQPPRHPRHHREHEHHEAPARPRTQRRSPHSRKGRLRHPETSPFRAGPTAPPETKTKREERPH